MELACALMSAMGDDETHRRCDEHLRRAAAGAAEGSLLAKNLEHRFARDLERLRRDKTDDAGK